MYAMWDNFFWYLRPLKYQKQILLKIGPVNEACCFCWPAVPANVCEAMRFTSRNGDRHSGHPCQGRSLPRTHRVERCFMLNPACKQICRRRSTGASCLASWWTRFGRNASGETPILLKPCPCNVWGIQAVSPHASLPNGPKTAKWLHISAPPRLPHFFP